APYQLAWTRQRQLAALWQPDRELPGEPVGHGVTWRSQDIVIADANDPSSRWFVTNDGFGDTPFRGAFCADPTASEPQLRDLPGAFWLSAAAGTKREGMVATASFSLEHRFVHVRVAGRHSRIKLVVAGLHLLRDPIYGSLHRNIE